MSNKWELIFLDENVASTVTLKELSEEPFPAWCWKTWVSIYKYHVPSPEFALERVTADNAHVFHDHFRRCLADEDDTPTWKFTINMLLCEIVNHVSRYDDPNGECTFSPNISWSPLPIFCVALILGRTKVLYENYYSVEDTVEAFRVSLIVRNKLENADEE